MDKHWTALNERMDQLQVSMVKHFDRLATRHRYFKFMHGRALTILAENAGIDLEKFFNFPEYSSEARESSDEEESEHVSEVQPK